MANDRVGFWFRFDSRTSYMQYRGYSYCSDENLNSLRPFLVRIITVRTPDFGKRYRPAAPSRTSVVRPGKKPERTTA